MTCTFEKLWPSHNSGCIETMVLELVGMLQTLPQTFLTIGHRWSKVLIKPEQVTRLVQSSCARLINKMRKHSSDFD